MYYTCTHYTHYNLHTSSNIILTNTLFEAVVHGEEMLLVLGDLTTDKALEVTM